MVPAVNTQKRQTFTVGFRTGANGKRQLTNLTVTKPHNGPQKYPDQQVA